MSDDTAVGVTFLEFVYNYNIIDNIIYWPIIITAVIDTSPLWFVGEYTYIYVQCAKTNIIKLNKGYRRVAVERKLMYIYIYMLHTRLGRRLKIKITKITVEKYEYLYAIFRI